jgi:hypothetical protein
MAFPRGRSQVQGVPMTAPGPSNVQDGDGPGVPQARDAARYEPVPGGGGKHRPWGLSLGTGQGWSVTGWGVAVPVRTCHGRSEGWHAPRTMHNDSPSDGCPWGCPWPVPLGPPHSLPLACSLPALSPHTPSLPPPHPWPIAHSPRCCCWCCFHAWPWCLDCISLHGVSIHIIVLPCPLLRVSQRASSGQWGGGKLGNAKGHAGGKPYYSSCSCNCRYC